MTLPPLSQAAAPLRPQASSPPNAPRATSCEAAPRDIFAPMTALQQQVATCMQPPVNPLGALKRSRELSRLWHRLIDGGTLSEPEREHAREAMFYADSRLTRMERSTRMTPAADFVLRFGDRTLSLNRGSIADANVAAVVTAANAELVGGGGVDHVVHAAAGPLLLEACRKIGGCETGSAVITSAFDLESRGVQSVIHAVGPVWRGGDYNEEALLRNAYLAALKLADANGSASMAFPAISCGVYRFPAQAAAQIALHTVADYLRATQGPLKEVIFVLFDDKVFKAFSSTLVDMAP